MKVICVRPFGGSGFRYTTGDIFELPDGVNWLEVGFVEPVEEGPETTTAPKAKRTTRRKKATTRKAKT